MLNEDFVYWLVCIYLCGYGYLFPMFLLSPSFPPIEEWTTFFPS